MCGLPANHPVSHIHNAKHTYKIPDTICLLISVLLFPNIDYVTGCKIRAQLIKEVIEPYIMNNQVFRDRNQSYLFKNR